MKEERKQEKQRMKVILQRIFKHHFKSVFFCYHYKSKAMLITYEDFKPECELQQRVEKAVGQGWYVTLKREFSKATIMEAMYDIYKRNEEMGYCTSNGDVVWNPVRVYVNSLITKREG